MTTVKLRDILLPKPFVGVALWTLTGIVATALFFAAECSQVGRIHPTGQTVDTAAESTESAIPIAASPQASPTAARPVQPEPAEVDATPTRTAPAFSPFANDGRYSYQEAWADRTHEIVVWKNENMRSQPSDYHLGEQGDRRSGGETITVAREFFGPDNDVRILVTKRGDYFASAVELKTARREQQLHARVWSEGHTYPQAVPEWIDISGHAYVNTWIWPEVKPLLIDYTLYGVRQGMRCSIHDRIVIDF